MLGLLNSNNPLLVGNLHIKHLWTRMGFLHGEVAIVMCLFLRYEWAAGQYVMG
jgi:hypothetical protein